MTRSAASAKAAGARFERSIADCLALHIDDRVDRRVRTGARDRGDITGLRHMGGRIVLEIKDYGGRYLLGPWLREVEIERGNDDALAGACVIKRRGISDPLDQVVVMTMRDLDSSHGGDQAMSGVKLSHCQHPDGCARPIKGHGWCKAHLQRITRTGDVGPAEIAGRSPLLRPCSVAGCEYVVDKSGGFGMCGMHYQRQRKHGSPHVVKVGGASLALDRNPNWSGDKASYAAVHLRLRHQQGPAAAHDCVDCAKPARHWSYDLADPNELRAPEGRYSTDLSRYEPRCVSCHKIHDLSQK